MKREHKYSGCAKCKHAVDGRCTQYPTAETARKNCCLLMPYAVGHTDLRTVNLFKTKGIIDKQRFSCYDKRVKESVLILDGSLGNGGNTASLLDCLFDSDYKGHAYFNRSYNISPCENCGACKKSEACCFCDNMEQIYQAAETVKRVVLASPVYFGNLTGFLLDVMSRFQRYFFKHGYDKLPRVGIPKEGAVILTAGGHGNTENAERTAKIFMKMLNVENPVFITSYQTDALPAWDDKEAINKMTDLKKRWWGV